MHDQHLVSLILGGIYMATKVTMVTVSLVCPFSCVYDSRQGSHICITIMTTVFTGSWLQAFQFSSYFTTYCPYIPLILFSHIYLWSSWCQYGNLIWIIFRVFFWHWGWGEQFDVKFIDFLLGDGYTIFWIKISQWEVCIPPGVFLKALEATQENYTLPDGISSTLSWWWDLRDPMISSYAGGSVATGRVSQAGQVKSEVPDKDTFVLQDGGWALGWHSNPIKKNKHVEKTIQSNSWTDGCLGLWLRQRFRKYEVKKQAGNAQRLSGMEEDCIGSQGPQQTVVLEMKKKKLRYWTLQIVNSRAYSVSKYAECIHNSKLQPYHYGSDIHSNMCRSWFSSLIY